MPPTPAASAPRRSPFESLANSPWWILSVGLHVALLLIATVLYAESYREVEFSEGYYRFRPTPIFYWVEPLDPCRSGESRKIHEDDIAEILASEPLIFAPKAQASDPCDRPDDTSCFGPRTSEWPESSSIFGISPRFLRDQDFDRFPANSRRLGVGPGRTGEGEYECRIRSHDALVRSGGGGRESEESVMSALRWLARHQDPDGGWSSAEFGNRCAGRPCPGVGYNSNNVAVTGLALLAFLGAGYTHLSSAQYTDRISGKTVKLGEIVKRGIRRLLAQQNADGGIGPAGGRSMYLHAIATLALCEAYGMTRTPVLKEPAQKAVDYLVAAKNPYRAWRYSPRCGENDTSVSGWCVMALKSAEDSGLMVGRSTLEEAEQFFEECTEPGYGRCGYQRAEDAGVQVCTPGKNDPYANHGTCTAVGMLVRSMVKRDRGDRVLDLGAAILAADAPRWDLEKKTNDYYYWYYGTLALFQVDGPDSGGAGKYWKPWIKAVLAALVKNQKGPADGCEDGSWTTQERWSYEGGRVYTTALNALTLEVFYRYPNVFTGADRRPSAKR